MSSKDEQRIIEAVCAALVSRSLMTKDLVSELAKIQIAITKKELNQLLYGRKDAIAGLSVSKDFVWSFSADAGASKKAQVQVRTEPKSTNKAPSTPAPPVPPRTFDFIPDPQQQAVIDEPAISRVFVEAGPGTGKTAVACRRIARLIKEEDLNPANILVISFTRTAVAEIRNRIAHYVNRASASQVRISTIDSSAWQLDVLYGEGSRDPEKGFDDTIESAMSLIREGDASLRDFLESLEHVVVDEAQDVTGIRNDFVVELVRALPKRCGVTIFADPMQSIYGFTHTATTDAQDADEASPPKDTLDPVSKLKQALPKFKELRLTETHRFSSHLDGVLSQARAVVQSNELEGVEKQRQLAEHIQTAAEPVPDDYRKIADIVRNEPSTLLLFRYRREVVQASSFLTSSGVPHRLRMPQLPDCIQPWVARIFWDHTAASIDKAAFTDRFAERCNSSAAHEPNAETAWESLRRLAPDQRNGVKVGKLRDVLSRPRPPVEACYLDSGHTGPTLGTIHASKGREAESVYVFVPAPITTGDVEEESRVLYVAATRARSRLYAREAFSAYGGRLSATGRCFKLETSKKGKSGKMEVGLSGDLHPIMSVSNRLHDAAEQVTSSQDVLWMRRNDMASLHAKRPQHGQEYRLSLADGPEGKLIVGSLSMRVHEDTMTISKMVNSRALPGWDLFFLSFTGSRTFVMPSDASSELEHAHEPYRSTGFFLVPHVRGYCRFYINNTGKQG